MLRNVKRRVRSISALAAALGLVALPFLPQSFTQRMGTIKNHQADKSASTRLAVWKWTLDYAKEHPFGGGFEAYRGNSFTYKLPVARRTAATPARSVSRTVTTRPRLSLGYFEMLGEQGLPGLALWLLIHALGLWQMERSAAAGAGRDERRASTGRRRSPTRCSRRSSSTWSARCSSASPSSRSSSC